MKQETNVQLRRWWLSELRAITARVQKEEEKRQTRERTKAEKLLGEYQTFADAQDAYGCGVITKRQYHRILDLLEQMKPVESDLYHAKIELLEELYTEQKKLLDDWEQWEATHK